jgi:DNA-binding CsgD family transcriptional regulator
LDVLAGEPVNASVLRTYHERTANRVSRDEMILRQGHSHPGVVGKGWFLACLDQRLDPRVATAEEVIGRVDDRIRADSHTRVLLASELHEVHESGEDWNDPLDAGSPLYAEVPEEVVPDIVSVVEVAGLTRREAEVVTAIMEGVPMSHGYAERLSERFGISAEVVRRHWSNAKSKLEASWVA